MCLSKCLSKHYGLMRLHIFVLVFENDFLPTQLHVEIIFHVEIATSAHILLRLLLLFGF